MTFTITLDFPCGKTHTLTVANFHGTLVDAISVAPAIYCDMLERMPKGFPWPSEEPSFTVAEVSVVLEVADEQ